MDVLLTVGMVGLMVVALVALGRTWPRSARGGGYRAGRGAGAAPGGGTGVADAPGTAGPEEQDVPWRWAAGEGRPGAPGSEDAAGDGPGQGGTGPEPAR